MAGCLVVRARRSIGTTCLVYTKVALTDEKEKERRALVLVGWNNSQEREIRRVSVLIQGRESVPYKT